MSHDHDHPHPHPHADPHAANHRPHPEAVVLEIGGALGALVVYTGPELLHAEIEISPAGDDGDRSHKDVLERVLNGRSLHAAVFDRVREGTYTLWHGGLARNRDVEVEGGRVAQVDWRTA
jgi:hypothetical protein